MEQEQRTSAEDRNFKAPETGTEDEESLRMEDDERYKKLLQEESLTYLKTKDREWFEQNYSGELSPDGYLIDKNGNVTNFLPSQNITGGFAEVSANARAKFTEMYPEDAQKYQLK